MTLAGLSLDRLFPFRRELCALDLLEPSNSTRNMWLAKDGGVMGGQKARASLTSTSFCGRPSQRTCQPVSGWWTWPCVPRRRSEGCASTRTTLPGL